MIWVPGERGRDITDDHIDALARFTRPGVVFVGRPFVGEGSDGGKELRNYWAIKRILGEERDARGGRMRVIDGMLVNIFDHLHLCLRDCSS